MDDTPEDSGATTSGGENSEKKSGNAAIGCLVVFLILAGIGGIFNALGIGDDDEVPQEKPSAQAEKRPGDDAAQRSAQVAKAVAYAKGYTELPEGKGMTFKGTYKSKNVTCVDLTDAKGTSGGYIVVGPKNNDDTGVLDGTCKLTADEAEAKFRSGVKNHVDKLQKVLYNASPGVDGFLVTWPVDNRDRAEVDVWQMLQAIQKLQKQGMKLDHVTFEGTADLVNKLGEERKGERVLLVEYDGDIVRRINWDYFDLKNVFDKDVASSVTIHPALSK